MTELDAVRALARASRLLERASGDLSLAHYRVLAAIAAGDARASRVAERLALGKPTISTTVDALCRRGLVTRTGVSGDQRANALAVTPAGTRLLAATDEAMLAKLRGALAYTPTPADVVAALTALGTALDELAAERQPTARQ